MRTAIPKYTNIRNVETDYHRASLGFLLKQKKDSVMLRYSRFC